MSVKKEYQSLLTLKNLLLFIMAVIILYLFTCKKKIDEKPPIVKPSTEIVQEKIDLDAITKHISDSFTNEIQQKDKVIQRYSSDYDDLMAEYLNYQNDISQTLTNTPIPDTCREIVATLNRQFTTLKKSSTDKDNTARNLITSLRQQNLTKDRFISAKDTAIKKYISLLDTCTKGYAVMENYIKKSKPKSEIYAGVSMLGNPNKILNGYGISLGLRNKKGTQFEISAININNTINYGLSIKKRLFKL